MAQHGYLRDYDERADRSGERDRWRDEDQQPGWRNSDRDRNEGNPGFMLGERGGASHYGREHGYGGFQGDFSRSGREHGGFGGRGDWERAPRNFSSHQDDHYRSWRDRQMEALDRDYADYCREREQQFHADFDSWRRQRQSSQQPLQTGITQSGQEVMELTDTAGQSTASDKTSPMGAATLGTNSSDEGSTGRGGG